MGTPAELFRHMNAHSQSGRGIGASRLGGGASYGEGSALVILGGGASDCGYAQILLRLLLSRFRWRWERLESQSDTLVPAYAGRRRGGAGGGRSEKSMLCLRVLDKYAEFALAQWLGAQFSPSAPAR